jgi:hypothetical protein
MGRSCALRCIANSQSLSRFAPPFPAQPNIIVFFFFFFFFFFFIIIIIRATRHDGAAWWNGWPSAAPRHPSSPLRRFPCPCPRHPLRLLHRLPTPSCRREPGSPIAPPVHPGCSCYDGGAWSSTRRIQASATATTWTIPILSLRLPPPRRPDLPSAAGFRARKPTRESTGHCPLMLSHPHVRPWRPFRSSRSPTTA